MRTAVIYARYSSERQTEQSIEGQLRVCNEFAKRYDLPVVDTYIDKAMTGTNDDRDAFQQMLSDSVNATWDIVLVYAIDRLGRDSADYAMAKLRLRNNHKILISATQLTSTHIDGTKNLDGILMENIHIGIAEYYSAELSQKVKRGLNESRMKSQSTGGLCIYGYRVVDKKYVIDEAEASVVRGVFDDYLNGKTVAAITDELAAKGIKNRRNKDFARNTVYRMLRLEKYNGIVRHEDKVYTNIVPRIVDESVFQSVQEINSANKRSPMHRKNHGKYLLSGKLFCGECGSQMTGESGTSRHGYVVHYYKCYGKKKHNGCRFPNARKDLIENKVKDFCKLIFRNEMIEHLAKNAEIVRKAEIEKSFVLKNLKNQLKSNQLKLDNLIRAIEEGIFTKSTKARVIELENEIEEIKHKLDVATTNFNLSLTAKDFSDYLYRFIDSKSPDGLLMDTIIEVFIKKIILYKDRMRIILNYPSNNPNGTSEDEFDIDLEMSDYKGISKGSDSTPFSPPNENNPNPCVSFGISNWSAWIANESLN